MSASKYPQFHGTGLPAANYLHVSKTFVVVDGKTFFHKGTTFKYPAGTNEHAEHRRARRRHKISARQWRLSKSIIADVMASCK